MTDTSAGLTTGQQPQVKLLLTAVLLAYLAQSTLFPVIAPLSRAVGLAEWQIGVTISTAAMMVVLTSRTWGRRSQSLGRKTVLVAAFSLALVAMTAFAVVSWLGMRGALTGTVLFILFVLLRGVGFGTALAAVPPTAQAYIADIATDEAARVKGMAGIGAVQGMSMIGGAVLGGALAAFGLLAPIVAVPVLLAAGLIVLTTRLRREPRHRLIPDPAMVRVLDPRVWPFLLAGFGMFTSLGFIQVVIGFVVQDRLHVDERMTGVLAGATLLAAGIGLLVAQAVIVPRSGWPAATLLRVGLPVSCLGFVVFIPDLGVAGILVANLVIGTGLGIAIPGYTAGPTMFMNRDEQGALAGLIGATNGLTFVIAPALGTTLYGVWPQLPLIAGAIVSALVAAFVYTHPRFTRSSS